MRKFISKLLLFLLPYLIAYITISLFNFTIDANCIFSRAQLLERIADDLLAGKIVSGLPHFEYRLFQKLIIKRKKSIPHTIALGSSPTLALRASHLGLDQKSFFNHSVPVAGINDFIALVGCYEKKGALPKTIIIGLNPYMFFENFSGDKRWKYIASNYYYLLPSIREDTPHVTIFYELIKANYLKVRTLISINYARANYIYFTEVRKKGFDYKVVNSTFVDDYLTLPDGSLYRPFKLRFQDDSITRKKVKRYLRSQIKKIKNRGQIAFQKTFRNFIDYILANGTQIVFFLPPYHPDAYQTLKRKGELNFLIEVEDMLRSLALSRKIPVFGSYDPSRFNLSSQDFFDVVHARDYVAEKIFEEYQEVAGE